MIPALEFIGVAVNIIVAYEYVGRARSAVYSDSLTTVDILTADSAHAASMQIIHDELRQCVEFTEIRSSLEATPTARLTLSPTSTRAAASTNFASSVRLSV